MHVDYIIVGQGIAGSLLWFELKSIGKSAVVIDSGMGSTSSGVAAGIINPITGRQMKVTWRAEELLQFAFQYYNELGSRYNTTLVHSIPMYRIIGDVLTRNEWERLMEATGYEHYLGEIADNKWPALHAPNGLGVVHHAFRVDSGVILSIIRREIQSDHALIDELFDYDQLRVDNSCVNYKGITAGKLVFCEGYQVRNNPYFKYLPIGFAKGEVLHVHIDDPLPEAILNKNGYLLPLAGKEYFLGATYDRDHADIFPTASGLSLLKSKLAGFTAAAYHIVSHHAGVRPTSKDRRPILGLHPDYSNIYIFNGLGTKGFSQAPLFARQLVHHMESGSKLWQEVDIARYNGLRV